MKKEILLVICISMITLLIVAGTLYYKSSNDYYGTKDIKIKRKVIDGISKNFKDTRFMICDIEKDKCLIFEKIK